MKKVLLVFVLVFLLMWFMQCDEDSTDPTNDAPVINNLSANPDSVFTFETSNIICNASDPEGEKLVYVWSTLNGSISGEKDSVIWIAPNNPCMCIIKCEVYDNEGESAIDSISIQVKSSSPLIESLIADPDTITVDDFTTLICSASDPNSSSLTYLWTSHFGSVQGEGASVKWFPPTEEGTYDIYCKIIDERGQTDIQKISVVVTPLLNTGLMAYYPFNGNAHDESGNGNDGVVYNAILTEDKLGNMQNAYQFNGNGYISVKPESSLNPNGSDFSISVWFKFYGIFDSSLITYCIISKGYYYRDSQQEWKIELRGGEYNGAYLRYRIYPEVPQDFMFEEDLSSIITDENWHHLVVVVNEGNSPEGKIYLDGELRGVREEFSLNIDPQENLQIGWYRGSGTYYKGVLDQIRIYKRALSQDEIEYLFENYL